MVLQDAYCSGLTKVTAYTLPHLTHGGRSTGTSLGVGYIKLEDITLPLRFSALTIHLVTLLMIFLTLKAYVLEYTGQPETAVPDATDTAWLRAATYMALICFGIEYITLLAGVTVFQRTLTFLNTLIHIVGLVLMIYFYNTISDPKIILVVVVLVNGVPAVSELLCWWYLLSASYSSY